MAVEMKWGHSTQRCLSSDPAEVAIGLHHGVQDPIDPKSRCGQKRDREQLCASEQSCDHPGAKPLQ